MEIFENPHEQRSMKRGMRSPRYTTHWDELPLVKAA